MKLDFLSNKIGKIYLTLVFLAFMLLISSCGKSTVTLIATPTVTSTTTPEIFIDCLWNATGKAWSDDNKNGIWDSTEKPLANITFWVDDPLNDYQKVNEVYADTVSTNVDGIVEIFVGLPGCPDVEFEVYTEVPQNCELTTKARIPADLKRENEVFSFGFTCY